MNQMKTKKIIKTCNKSAILRKLKLKLSLKQALKQTHKLNLNLKNNRIKKNLRKNNNYTQKLKMNEIILNNKKTILKKNRIDRIVNL